MLCWSYWLYHIFMIYSARNAYMYTEKKKKNTTHGIETHTYIHLIWRETIYCFVHKQTKWKINHAYRICLLYYALCFFSSVHVYIIILFRCLDMHTHLNVHILPLSQDIANWYTGRRGGKWRLYIFWHG